MYSYIAHLLKNTNLMAHNVHICKSEFTMSVMPAGYQGASGVDECTFTNTAYFEGIPTLNQYGMAIMALLMLGVGFIGFRRFV